MRRQIVFGVFLAGLLVEAVWGQSLNEQLFAAVKAGNKATVDALIAKGADVNAKDKDYGQTPLNESLRTQKKDVAELLIAKGADVNAKGTGGETPLHSEAWADNSNLAKLLIAKGADVNAKDSFSQTPLHQDAFAGNRDSAELLIAKGANVNTKDNDGNTPLHYAARRSGRRSKDVAELLIAKGADVNAKNKGGQTPLHKAGGKDVAQLLIAKGADVNAIDNQGRTPLDVAGEGSPNQEMQAFLLVNGGKSTQSHETNSREDIQSLLTKFKGHSNDDVLRADIINLAATQRTAIPGPAEAAAGRGAYIFKNAKTPDDALSAAKEYLTAIEIAPWVANYYYNLCTVLEKTPYAQQALHACKLYLLAAPNAPDAGDMTQRIAGLQYAADSGKAQMKQRTAYIKTTGREELYRYGGISGTVSGKDIALKLVVDWYAAPPKYQIFVACIESDGAYGHPHDLVTTDSWSDMCKSGVNMHLVIKPEGEGFVELSYSQPNKKPSRSRSCIVATEIGSTSHMCKAA